MHRLHLMHTTQAIRQRLIVRRRHLLNRYRDELARIEEELSTPQPEPVDLAAEQWDAKLLTALGDVDLRGIVAVMAALARLDAGVYGRCVECDHAIGAARLRALPEAINCIECARRAAQPVARSA